MFFKNFSTLLKSRFFLPISFGFFSILFVSFLILDIPNLNNTNFERENSAKTKDNPSNLAIIAPLITEPATKNDKQIYQVSIDKNDSLSAIFSRLNINQTQLLQALDSDKKAKKLFSQLKINQQLIIEVQNEQLIRIFSQLSPLESIELIKKEENFTFNHQQEIPTIVERYAHGIIDDSLYMAAKNINLPSNLINELANIFAYDIDFTQDIRKGDEFELIYEAASHNNQSIGTRNILAARFVVQGKNYTAIRYKNNKGEMSYFDAEGRAMRKQFLRNPVDFVRITSRFSLGRYHPILHKIRAHRGVDYGAKTGTPAKATANGTVIFSGWQNGYGNVVKIQHSSKYRTVYAHLSKFNAKAMKGAKVKQGQVIGYVGQTGLAKGPHLHYEFQINGVHVNPLTNRTIALDPVPVANKQTFIEFSVPLIAKMDAEKARILAMLK